MKPKTTMTLAALALICAFPAFAPAQARTEQQLLEVLRSGASLQEKDAACAELKRVGTVQAVPVLAGLLTDPDLSHAARYALESLPTPEAGSALIGALDKTTGPIKAGIIHSIGQRQDPRAVSALGRLLTDHDNVVAAASATALGRIGGPEAIQALQGALSKAASPSPRGAVIDALLAAADQELAAGRKDAASDVFERLRKLPVPDHVRTAAYRGMIDAASPGRAVALIRTALAGPDGPELIAALETARRRKDPETTRVLCAATVKAAPPLKVALIEALRERRDTAAAASFIALAKSPDETVRASALAGLGELGDAASVPLLLERAASNSESDARTAREALLVLNRGEVTRALAAQLAAGEEANRVEAARALAGRGDKNASASLIAAARVGQEPVLGAALRALGQLAEPGDIPALVRLVVETKSDSARDEARDALSAACLRLQSRGVRVDAAPIVDGLAAASPPARGALLEAGSVLADEHLRAALRRSLSDPGKDVRDPAVRALCQTRDPGLLPDLLDLAARPAAPDERVLAVRGYVRLVNDTENTPLGPAERVKALTDILPFARAEEKWLVLSGLAKWPDLGALSLALPMLDDPATRVEAMQATTQISTGLASSHREHARMALEKVLAAASEPIQRESALSAIKQLDPAFGTGSSVTFRRVKVDGRFRSEGVAVADFNRDGRLDIATGNILYLGPDWKPQPMKAEAKEYQPEGYSDEFLCFVEDIDRDGWPDLIVVGFPGAKTRWLRNPGRRGGPWPEFLAIEKTGNESPDWTDVDRDGRRELVFVSENGLALARPGADPKKPWPIRVIAGPQDPRPGHGLGVGDVNGDGRPDIVCPDGWWEGPAGSARVPWTFHAAPLAPQPPAQMPVLDVNGDGRADVLSSGAHRYGLWWTEQTAEGWRTHEIDHDISQLHALHLADINGDGLPDLVTGKRFWAHREGDEGIDDPAVLCWFEMTREPGKPAWIRHDIDFDSGVGLHVQIADLDGDGLLDIVSSNKKGVNVFLQERRPAVPTKAAAKAQDMYHKPLVFAVPGMDAVEVLRDITYKTADGTDLKMDISIPLGLPAGARVPVIFFIHGGFIPKTVTFLPKEWGVFQSYGRLAAASGFVGVTFNHRYWGWSREDMERTFGDVTDAIRYVRSHAADYHVDADRVALWAFSGGGPHLSLALREKLGYVRCLVSFYGIMDLTAAVQSRSLDPKKEGTAGFSPVTYLGQKGVELPPIFIGRAGLDAPTINETIDRFAARAKALNATIEVMDHPKGHHGFDILDDDARSREIIARALEFVKAHI